jgi:hypothetical protein
MSPATALGATSGRPPGIRRHRLAHLRRQGGERRDVLAQILHDVLDLRGVRDLAPERAAPRVPDVDAGVTDGQRERVEPRVPARGGGDLQHREVRGVTAGDDGIR